MAFEVSRLAEKVKEWAYVMRKWKVKGTMETNFLTKKIYYIYDCHTPLLYQIKIILPKLVSTRHD